RRFEVKSRRGHFIATISPSLARRFEVKNRRGHFIAPVSPSLARRFEVKNRRGHFIATVSPSLGRCCHGWSYCHDLAVSRYVVGSGWYFSPFGTRVLMLQS
ncbi:hypothetical protein RJ641_011249, partial [Dillenia turbinata]